MIKIQWDEKYNTNVREIDKQHRKIVGYLNDLFALSQKEFNTKETDKAITNLEDYIKYHFSAEEEYMQKVKYEGFDQQKQQHDAFIDKVYEYRKSFAKDKKIIVVNLFNFVWDWFAKHILIMDKKFDPKSCA